MRYRNLFGMVPVCMVAACATTDIGSIVGGECRLVKSPQYQVIGRTNYDQVWINETTEAIISGCGQPRPMVRPASLDAPRPKGVAAAPKAKPKGRIRTFLGV